MANLTYAQAIRKVIQEEMQRDDKIFCMGEDCEKLGGVFGTTRDLYLEFGTDRIRNTPISESAIVGAAVGAASAGMRPIAELMYWDFAFVAADQIFNQMCKTRYVFGGNAKLPIVLRSQQGTGRGNAATHSQSLETIFMHIPGVKVACPSTPAEAAGLLRTAIRDDNPICFVEHKALYITKGEVPDDPEFMIPFGKADIKREGKDLTIITWSRAVNFSLEAADMLAKEGIDVEVLDLRTLVPIDWEAIKASVSKTHNVIIVSEEVKRGSYAGEISAQIAEELFDELDAPVERVCGLNIVSPFSPVLEDLNFPHPEDIAKAVKRVLNK